MHAVGFRACAQGACVRVVADVSDVRLRGWGNAYEAQVFPDVQAVFAHQRQSLADVA